jgi:hypothetical protein
MAHAYTAHPILQAYSTYLHGNTFGSFLSHANGLHETDPELRSNKKINERGAEPAQIGRTTLVALEI